MRKKGFISLLFLLAAAGSFLLAREFSIENGLIRFSVKEERGLLREEILTVKRTGFSARTDAGFMLKLVWTGWRAPGKLNNSENPVAFTQRDFRIESSVATRSRDGGAQLRLQLKGRNNPLQLEIVYRLKPGEFFVRKAITVRDPQGRNHFLQKIALWKSELPFWFEVVKEGGYGQPAAVVSHTGGAFWGVEYPAATCLIRGKRLYAYHIVGERISREGIKSEWGVFGVTPDRRVKYWFFRYIDRMRVAPLRPYLLYNSWYDLRAPEMVKDPARVMNEENSLAAARLFRQRLLEKYGVKLDAFVLDDGWDIYKSDWKLSRQQFPRGLKPLADYLKSMGTRLGIWIGPIGGYSHRSWRVGWMKSHGYEVVGDQLCLGGRRYSELFKKRVLEFMRLYSVAYFKWDGIQFSCSEPDHGHPVGIYSRRAILKKLQLICQLARKENPDVFLNITSGTWLSPWWLLLADQIWMQGHDYGYAAVPSISRRDRAMTYRDYVLYDDFKKKGFWFPISNLMTHGIIKGHLQKLGGEAEPLDKFTNNAVLYFARGISMYELYISPDLLTDDEWKAIALSYLWAKDRFSILTHYCEMVGGDPGQGQAYGYVHFKGRRGIIALRNPSMEPAELEVRLSPEYGLDSRAENLVVEKVYPYHAIERRLYRCGESLKVKLNGFETAVYEIYPAEEAAYPLVAGAVFSLEKEGKKEVILKIFRADERPVLLNPEAVSWIKAGGKKLGPHKLPAVAGGKTELTPARIEQEGGLIEITFSLKGKFHSALLAVLQEPEAGLSGKELPSLRFQPSEGLHLEKQKGSWAWYTLPVREGENHIRIKMKGGKGWKGKLSFWVVVREKSEPEVLRIKMKKEVRIAPQLPLPFPEGVMERSRKLGEVRLEL